MRAVTPGNNNLFYHNTALQSSSVSIPSTKIIGGLIGLVWLPLQHHLGIISDSKNGFSFTKSKRMVSESSSHHSSSYPSTKNLHTKHGYILDVNHLGEPNISQNGTFFTNCPLNYLKPEFLMQKMSTSVAYNWQQGFSIRQREKLWK